MVALVGPSGSGKRYIVKFNRFIGRIKKGKNFLNQKLLDPTSVKDRNKIRLNEIGFFSISQIIT